MAVTALSWSQLPPAPSSPIKEDSPEIWHALGNLLVAAGSPAVSLRDLSLLSRRCLLIPASTQYQDLSSPHTRSQLAICGKGPSPVL